MLEQAKAKNAATRWELHESYVTALPFPDKTFDYAYCLNSFHYFPKPLEALRELRRVTRHGGTLVLVDWCDDYLACKLCSVWLRLVDPAFHRTYNKRDSERLFRDAEFRVKNSARFRVGWIWGVMQIEVCRD